MSLVSPSFVGKLPSGRRGGQPTACPSPCRSPQSHPARRARVPHVEHKPVLRPRVVERGRLASISRPRQSVVTWRQERAQNVRDCSPNLKVTSTPILPALPPTPSRRVLTSSSSCYFNRPNSKPPSIQPRVEKSRAPRHFLSRPVTPRCAISCPPRSPFPASGSPPTNTLKSSKHGPLLVLSPPGLCLTTLARLTRLRKGWSCRIHRLFQQLPLWNSRCLVLRPHHQRRNVSRKSSHRQIPVDRSQLTLISL
jgi:hypothetical protein